MYSGWYNPATLIPPHEVIRPAQVAALAQVFQSSGWDTAKPTLRGYQNEAGIQLLSGTHRRAAAILAGIQVPVVVWDEHYVSLSWGTAEWDRVMGIGVYKHEENKLYA